MNNGDIIFHATVIFRGRVPSHCDNSRFAGEGLMQPFQHRLLRHMPLPAPTPTAHAFFKVGVCPNMGLLLSAEWGRRVLLVLWPLGLYNSSLYAIIDQCKHTHAFCPSLEQASTACKPRSILYDGPGSHYTCKKWDPAMRPQTRDSTL